MANLTRTPKLGEMNEQFFLNSNQVSIVFFDPVHGRIDTHKSLFPLRNKSHTLYCG